jgi:hypothetical protein
MKRIITLLIILTSFSAVAQQVSPEVIASAGDHFENEDISISWTLGEPVIATLDAEYILTQGFHQDLYIITSVDEIEITEFSVNVYPNPTRDLVNIAIQQDSKQAEAATIQLMDTKGSIIKEINKSKEDNSPTQFNLASYERSNYFLRVIMNGKIKTYKIIKI